MAYPKVIPWTSVKGLLQGFFYKGDGKVGKVGDTPS